MGWKKAMQVERHLSKHANNIGSGSIFHTDSGTDGPKCMVGYGLDCLGVTFEMFSASAREWFENTTYSDDINSTNDKDGLEFYAELFGAPKGEPAIEMAKVLGKVIMLNDGTGPDGVMNKSKAAELMVSGIKEFTAGE